MYNNRKITAIILAAGSSSRMGTDKPTALLLGKPVLYYSLIAFEKSCADEIIVVGSENNIASLIAICKKCGITKPVRVITGGDSRDKSALIGVNNAKGDIVSIHDCARPLVTENIINESIISACEKGASIVAVPVKDTIKQIKGECIESTPDRSTLSAAQTPQSFNKELYLKAAEKTKGIPVTDDASVFEKAGIPVYITTGDYTNIKLTTPEDIIIAEAFLKEREK